MQYWRIVDHFCTRILSGCKKFSSKLSTTASNTNSMAYKDYDSKMGHARMNSDSFVLASQDSNAAEIKNPDIVELKKRGYIILERLLDEHQIQEIKNAMIPLRTRVGRNNFEGEKTHRIYALLAKSRAFDQLVLHPRINAILDAMLLPNHLITAFQAIEILPGETAQPLHYDDQFMNVPRPREALSVSTIWAIDEFTAVNGATKIIPNSHLWDDRLPTKEDPLVPILMPAGSVVVFLSTLWHCGGENSSQAARLAISSQHCQPWIRPMENQFLIMEEDEVVKLHPKIQAMMGYSIHYPFIGHVDGYHPSKVLEQRAKQWQKIKSSKL